MLALLAQDLEQRVDVEAKGERLFDVLDRLADESGLRFALFEPLPEDRVTLTLRDITLRSALGLLLGPRDRLAEPWQGVLRIIRPRFVLEIYDVRDLLFNVNGRELPSCPGG